MTANIQYIHKLPEVKVGGELTLHLLEHGVLSRGLGPPCQTLARRARERLTDTRHVLNAHAERHHLQDAVGKMHESIYEKLDQF